MLGPITAVTIAAPELQRMIDVYRLYLGYELVEHGKLTHEQAGLWARPGLAGRRYALMLPGGEGDTYIRFIESRASPAYQAFRHMGWNAAELIVQDTDACAARLADSPFQIIGPPADLSFSSNIRAMQALGPAKEALYLTSFKERMAEFDVPEAKHFIDRTFIVILGGPSCQAINAFYTQHFGVPTAQIIPVVISVLSNAQGLPSDTKHDLAAIPLAGQSYIEADAMPAATLPRTSEGDELPPAIAMVSFIVDALPSPEALTYAAPPRAIAEAPYRGRRSAICTGPAGEIIELIESP